MILKRTIIHTFVIVLSVIYSATVASAQDTMFTYQGELKQGGNLANGLFNMEFSLWNASVGGTQIDVTITQNGMEVVEGKFSVDLDFGAEAFNNTDRWLEIAVDGFTLSPRNQITRSPYSVQTRGIFVDETKRVGLGTTNPAARLDVISDTTNSGNNTARFSAPLLGPNTSHVHYGTKGNWFIRSAADDGKVILQDTGGIVNVGPTSGTEFGRFTVRAEDSAFAINAESDNDFFPTIFAVNNGLGPVLWLDGANDAEPDGGGVLVVGSEFGQNIAIDNNEIMARDNGQPSTLFLNADGGNIKRGQHQISAPYVYGRVDTDGSLLSGSSNIISTQDIGVGWYRIDIEGGIRSSDIIMVSGYNLIQASGSRHTSGSLDVRTILAYTGDLFDGGFSFVIYRH